MDRKEFLLKGTAVCGLASTITFLNSCSKTTPINFTIDLANPVNAPLLTVGGYVIQNNAYVRKTATGYVALSLICTHQGCIVLYRTGSTPIFACPCHSGTYDTNGNVTGGPPPSALIKLNVTESANVLTVTS